MSIYCSYRQRQTGYNCNWLCQSFSFYITHLQCFFVKKKKKTTTTTKKNPRLCFTRLSFILGVTFDLFSNCLTVLDLLQTFSVFSIRTRHCRFLVRTTTEKEEDTHDWLYALDPLLVGSIRYDVFYYRMRNF